MCFRPWSIDVWRCAKQLALHLVKPTCLQFVCVLRKASFWSNECYIIRLYHLLHRCFRRYWIPAHHRSSRSARTIVCISMPEPWFERPQSSTIVLKLSSSRQPCSGCRSCCWPTNVVFWMWCSALCHSYLLLPFVMWCSSSSVSWGIFFVQFPM